MKQAGGRLLALDVGTKRIGVAVCDSLRMMASPLTTVKRQSVRVDSAAIGAIAVNEAVVGVVVGLPLGLDGGDTRSTRLARQVGEAVRGVTGLPLAYHDERFSSVEAERRLLEQDLSRKARKARIDQSAAAVILQDFIDSSESEGFAITPQSASQ
jgi:putative Holliday junction resolvase